MAAVPVVINGVFMPKGKTANDKPIPAVFIGYATIAGLHVDGGPIIPEPPIEPPIEPPTETPPPSLAVVIKPAPSTGGWGLAAQGDQLQWFYTPGQSGAGPKR
jgi:hypothetical protein